MPRPPQRAASGVLVVITVEDPGYRGVRSADARTRLKYVALYLLIMWALVAGLVSLILCTNHIRLACPVVSGDLIVDSGHYQQRHGHPQLGTARTSPSQPYDNGNTTTSGSKTRMRRVRSSSGTVVYLSECEIYARHNRVAVSYLSILAALSASTLLVNYMRMARATNVEAIVTRSGAGW